MSDQALREAVLRMGREIVRQFGHLDHHSAVEEVSAHLLKFWEPRLRAELRRCVADSDLDAEAVLAQAVCTWPDEEETQADRREPSGG